jgi:osmotically-inducible protein OsmY
MEIIKRITMTWMLTVLIGCQTMTVRPSPDELPLPPPAGVETPQDAALSKAVKERLLAEKGVDLSRVIVETRKGTVYVSGIVSSLEARERALKIPWQVSGVQSVMNRLQVGE